MKTIALAFAITVTLMRPSMAETNIKTTGGLLRYCQELESFRRGKTSGADDMKVSFCLGYVGGVREGANFGYAGFLGALAGVDVDTPPKPYLKRRFGQPERGRLCKMGRAESGTLAREARPC